LVLQNISLYDRPDSSIATEDIHSKDGRNRQIWSDKSSFPAKKRKHSEIQFNDKNTKTLYFTGKLLKVIH
jgi:hypothetical protein